MPMAVSFIEWAFAYFNEQSFGMAGKTVGSFRRNVLSWLLPLLRKRRYIVNERRDENLIKISKNGKTNTFYIFGGRDESSQDLVQGLTAAGFLFDEVVLMPESFVNQATARCSVDGSKLWFNCNPEGPSHYFKLEWVDKVKEKNLVYLHFTQDDNPGLTSERKAYYLSLYPVGSVFYKRYILGLWVQAEGSIFSMLSDENFYTTMPYPEATWDRATQYVSIDYGTQNATVFGHFLDDGKNIWLDSEYYHSGRNSYHQKTDSQYADDLDEFCKGKKITAVIIDPSAASLKIELENRGYTIIDADNEVLDGIRLTSSVINKRILMINRRCVNVVREMQSYVWDPKPTEKGKEQPLKKDDHGPDMVRYYIKTMFPEWRLTYG